MNRFFNHFRECLVYDKRLANNNPTTEKVKLDVADALDDPREVPLVLADKEAFDNTRAEVTA